MMSQQISKDTIYKIREEVLKGKSKRQVAKEYDLSDNCKY